jgi:hypothetical protein
MYFDPDQRARRVIADFQADLVGQLPKSLLASIALFEASDLAQGPHPAVPDDLGERNIESKILELTQTIILSERYWDARNRVRDHLAQQTLAEFANEVPAIIERLRPQFDATASEYAAAVSMLPDDHRPPALVHAGGAAVDNYRRAVDAEHQLGRFNDFTNALQNVPGFAARREPIANLLRPTTRAELQQLIDAADKREPDSLNPVFLKAIEIGVPFEFHSPIEAAEIIDAVNAQPVTRNIKNMRFVTLR